MFTNFKEFFYADEQVLNLYFTTKKITEIAEITKKSVGEVYRILHRNNITPNRIQPNHQCVIDFASSGLPIKQIAELTGYTPRNVRYILEKMEGNASK